MKIAILFIVTGKYICFWEDFYKSCEKYFLKNHQKTYFLFTDDTEMEVAKNVAKIKHKFRGWPEETLLRFDTFLKVEDELKEHDYIYFINGTMVPVAEIGEEIFPTQEQGLMVTLHPGFYKKPRETYTYDENLKSLAFIPKDKGKYYFMGGFNGGTSKDFLKLIYNLDYTTKEDFKKGIIALWHDESHLNKYMLDKKPLILTPDYGFPEGMPFNQENLVQFKNNFKMLIKDKSLQKYGGHDWLRGIDENTIKNKKELNLWQKIIDELKNKLFKQVAKNETG